MSAFDTPITPAGVTPSNTNEATLFTASAATSVLVDATNLGGSAIAVRVGIRPNGGGATQWKVYDAPLPVGESMLGLGPWFLGSGDEIVVRTDTANDAAFSVTGVRST